MKDKQFNFPPNFYWGAATSAHQVEGGNNNDWSEWEKKNADRLVLAAQNGIWPDYILKNYPSPLQKENYISGAACDHYNRYEKDFDLARSLGHNCHRFSIEWSRVEPQEGIFDEKELAHYREVILALRERGLEPFLTIYHWTQPFWFRDKGAWLNAEAPRDFARLAERLVREFSGTGLKFWMTINEPMIYSTNGYLRDIWPPQKKNIFAYWQVINNLISAHILAYGIIKKIQPGAIVGIAKNNIYFSAQGAKLINNFIKFLADWWWNFRFLDKISGHIDFIGLNHYFHNRIDYGFNKNENKKISDMGWELFPEALYYVILDLKKYKCPIYITENGLADAMDSRREWFVVESLKNVAAAIDDGADVRGYFYWSLLDNFEWDKGFWPRFGLVEIDYRTQERRIRPSAAAYAKICKNNFMLL
ncbi:MAG: glycoside hydrolase family 1 protein [Candidatus Niyogibacteria bacterium]|nr:glycoside hydrolase family 1 protein [Candidatus Niyogibacteria bacterium]